MSAELDKACIVALEDGSEECSLMRINHRLARERDEAVAELREAWSRIDAAVEWLDDPDCAGDLPRRDVRDLRRIILGQPPYPAALGDGA